MSNVIFQLHSRHAFIKARFAYGRKEELVGLPVENAFEFRMHFHSFLGISLTYEDMLGDRPKAVIPAEDESLVAMAPIPRLPAQYGD